MPEGVSPASGVLMTVMREIFIDFNEWMIVIHYHLLVCAHDYDDAYRKLQLVIDRAHERNVVLKMAKSWLGVKKVRFLGYDVTHGKFEMGEDRKAEIMKMEFPKGTKKMQSFLGSALFFKNFIINYSNLTANVTEMTHKDFNWDEKTWMFDYRGDFDKLKEKIMQCVAIHFPDYTLVWILRTDASDVACGVVLFQVYVAPRGKGYTS
jgi:hypothetical protein